MVVAEVGAVEYLGMALSVTRLPHRAVTGAGLKVRGEVCAAPLPSRKRASLSRSPPIQMEPDGAYRGAMGWGRQSWKIKGGGGVVAEMHPTHRENTRAWRLILSQRGAGWVGIEEFQRVRRYGA